MIRLAVRVRMAMATGTVSLEAARIRDLNEAVALHHFSTRLIASALYGLPVRGCAGTLNQQNWIYKRLGREFCGARAEVCCQR
jgi:hypothetical protein